jgi:RNase P protein component
MPKSIGESWVSDAVIRNMARRKCAIAHGKKNEAEMTWYDVVISWRAEWRNMKAA